jgi:hypothetical protein
VEPPPPWLSLLYFAAQKDFVDFFEATSPAHHDACHIGVSEFTEGHTHSENCCLKLPLDLLGFSNQTPN